MALTLEDSTIINADGVAIALRKAIVDLITESPEIPPLYWAAYITRDPDYSGDHDRQRSLNHRGIPRCEFSWRFPCPLLPWVSDSSCWSPSRSSRYGLRPPAEAISVGSLGAVGAAFAAYIGKTFIRSQETAVSHLRAYFDQPLELSRYLAAERLLADAAELTAEQRAASLGTLVQAIATARHQDAAAPKGEPAK